MYSEDDVMQRNDVFTTTQVAKFCRVSQQVIIRAARDGQIKHWRIPVGARHFRFTRDAVMEFMTANKMTLGPLLEVIAKKVLLISRDEELESRLRDDWPEGDLVLNVAASSFEAGISAHELRPDCLVVDMDGGKDEARHICKCVRESELQGICLAVIYREKDDLDGLDSINLDERFRQPLDPALLVERVSTLVGFVPALG